jgi:REP element-mobilizing transposase RayT
VARGNNKKRIFRSAGDYKKLLSIITETKEKLPFYLYSFSLLPNHYHLGLETQDIPISKIMHRVNFLYAMYFNYRHKKSGHLFQDRFYGALVDKEDYLWEFSRYIDLNPVKAGLARAPQDYKWGSFRFYYQKDYSGKLIDRERFLTYIHDDPQKAREVYLKFAEEGLEEWRALKNKQETVFTRERKSRPRR